VASNRCRVCSDHCRGEFCCVSCRTFYAELKRIEEEHGYEAAGEYSDSNHPNVIARRCR